MNDLIVEYAKKCGVSEPEGFAENCRRFFELLIEANRIMNLTRIVEYPDFAIKHVIDSLAIAEYFPALTAREIKIADIGCGGGFPSMILAMAFPNWQITAIDSTGKKVRFVGEAAGKLGLKNLTAIQGRANELNRKAEFTEKFDIVTARAVAPGIVIYLDTDRFLRRGGKYIFYKTPAQTEEELPNIRRMGSRGKLCWEATPVFSLPENSGERQFIYSR